MLNRHLLMADHRPDAYNNSMEAVNFYQGVSVRDVREFNKKFHLSYFFGIFCFTFRVFKNVLKLEVRFLSFKDLSCNYYPNTGFED